jgi:hypothetical protein
MKLEHEVQDIATELQMWASANDLELTLFESLQIAVQVQKNKLYRDCNFKDADYTMSNLDSIEESVIQICHSFKGIDSALSDLSGK